MKQKVFVLTNEDGHLYGDLQALLDDGWMVVHATPRSINSSFGSAYFGPIVYILQK